MTLGMCTLCFHHVCDAATTPGMFHSATGHSFDPRWLQEQKKTANITFH